MEPESSMAQNPIAPEQSRAEDAAIAPASRQADYRPAPAAGPAGVRDSQAGPPPAPGSRAGGPASAPGAAAPFFSSAQTPDFLLDVRLTVSVEVGRVQLPLREIMELGPGAVVELSRSASEPVEIYAN